MSGIIEVSPAALLAENIFFALSAAIYVLVAILHGLQLTGKKSGFLAMLLLKAGFLLHTAFLVLRAINVRRVPFVGHYEFGNLFIWATVLLYLLLLWRSGDKYKSAGIFLTPIIILYLAYLTVFPALFPSINISRTHTALKPILQSGWLKIHVSASAFAYAGFTLAFTAAVMWFVKTRQGEKSPLARMLPTCNTLEEYMYRSAVTGFLFQSIMIITGAIWADISWGRYWGWDPKEVWALITWFVYAIYLHARLTRGWTGIRAAALVVIGWLAMLFTWIGVAWWLTGIHSFS